MRPLQIFTIFIFAIFLSACGQERAKSRLDQIRESGVLRIGTTGDYKPFSYRYAGELAGIDILLADELAKSLGVRVEYIETSWPTLMDDLMADKYDIGMSGITITEERKKLAMFSLPMHEGGKAAISRDGEAENYDTLAEINQPHVRVIFNPGGTNERFARENFPGAQLILNPENITVFEKIVAGKADVMVTDAIETIVQQQIHPELDAVNPDRPFTTSQKAYLIQNDDAFKAYLDHWMNELRSSGKLAIIVAEQIEISARGVK